jgi:IS30 family transposase
MMTLRYPPKGPPSFGRAPSRTHEIDAALMRGGTLDDIARDLDTVTSTLRRHIRRRVASGRWRFDVTATTRLAGREVATAGKLHKVEVTDEKPS